MSDVKLVVLMLTEATTVAFAILFTESRNKKK
jgi:hypothetical protein